MSDLYEASAITFEPRTEGGFFMLANGKPIFKAPSLKNFTHVGGNRAFLTTSDERAVDKAVKRLNSGRWTVIKNATKAKAARETRQAEMQAKRDAAKAASDDDDDDAPTPPNGGQRLSGMWSSDCKAIREGTHDANLAALRANETRPSVQKALDARMSDATAQVKANPVQSTVTPAGSPSLSEKAIAMKAAGYSAEECFAALG